MSGSGIGFVEFLFSQPAGDQGIDTYSCTDTDGDDEHLNRKDQRDGGESSVADLCDEDTVYNIIHRLQCHGTDGRYGHGKQKLRDRHDAHFVFLQLSASAGILCRIFFHHKNLQNLKF